MANPYRLRRISQEQMANLLPEKQQKQILTLGDAWAGRMQITPFQIKLLSYGGLLIGIGAGLNLTRSLDRYGLCDFSHLCDLRRFALVLPSTTI